MTDAYTLYRDRVKERIDIVDVIGESVELKRRGSAYKGLCPFHNEKTPSFNVNQAGQFFHCFGCGKGGDVIEFVMESRGIDYREAMELLAGRAGVEMPKFRPEDVQRQSEYDLVRAANLAAAEYYYKALFDESGSEARTYLKGRGIGEKEARKYRLGYAPADMRGLTEFARERGVDAQALELAGILARREDGSGMYARFRERVMFPIFDRRARVVGMAGRALRDGDRIAKYINSSETAMYSKGEVLYGIYHAWEAIRSGDEAVLVEGYLDVISLHQAGIDNAVAVCGTALTDGHAQALSRLCGRVVLVFDGDDAGAAAVLKSAGSLLRAGLDVTVVKLPDGHDPDSYVREHGGASLQELFFQGGDIWEHLAGGKLESDSVGATEIRLKLVGSLIHCVADPVRRELMTIRASKLLKVSKTLLETAVSEAAKHEGRRWDRENAAPPVPAQGGATPVGNAERDYNATDLGNALRLRDAHGEHIRYNDKPFGKWFIWDDRRWQEDMTLKIYSHVDDVVRGMYAQAAKLDDQDERKKLSKQAYSLESLRKQRAMVDKARTLQELSISVDDINQNHYLFNVRNGTIDLSRGDDIVFRQHDPRNYITKLADVDYVPGAQCPKWERFLGEIFAGNEEVIPYMQRVIGYSLTGDVSEQCMFFAHGTGANGKSVFFNTIELLFGDYWGKAPTEMIMQQRFQQVPTDVADLMGKRFVVCAELDDGQRFAESRIKDLTGGDAISARRMREDYFNFKPTHKLCIFGNHKPDVRGTDHGIWRRLKLIPFAVTIPDERKVPMGQLMAGFKGELSGILNWALDGYLDYRERGMNDPDVVTSAVTEYKSEQNIIGMFITDYCFENPQVSVEAKRLWQVYQGWCDGHGEHAWSSRRLYQKLREMGYDIYRGTGNKQHIRGLAVNDGVEEELKDGAR